MNRFPRCGGNMYHTVKKACSLTDWKIYPGETRCTGCTRIWRREVLCNNSSSERSEHFVTDCCAAFWTNILSLFAAVLRMRDGVTVACYVILSSMFCTSVAVHTMFFRKGSVHRLSSNFFLSCNIQGCFALVSCFVLQCRAMLPLKL